MAELWPGDCPKPYETTLQRGMNNPCVLLAKSRLVLHGYLDAEATYFSIFDEQMEAAVKKFQLDRGLYPTGVIDHATWYELLQDPVSKPPTSKPPSKPPQSTITCKEPYQTIMRGSVGPCVELAQRRLKLHGFDPGPIDGIFGPRTEDATKRFQRAKGLVDDGIIGPKTWAALMQAPTVPQTPITPPPSTKPQSPLARIAWNWPLIAMIAGGVGVLVWIWRKEA